LWRSLFLRAERHVIFRRLRSDEQAALPKIPECLVEGVWLIFHEH